MKLLGGLLKLNTLRTTIGFVFNYLNGLLPFSLGSRSLTKIYNYVPIQGLVQTSGQPNEHQLNSIAKSGITTVLNLAPHAAENALANEAGLVQSLGMQYLHIPVDFRKPSEEDFERFVKVLDQHDYQSLWVHCAANMRVSAFIYRYRVGVKGVDSERAKVDLDKVWSPVGVWRKFIAQAE